MVEPHDNLEIPAPVSPAYLELRRYISGINAPYSLADIQGFNSIYQHAYGSLSRQERRRIEAFVDTMIEQVEEQQWAAKIFGVV